VLCRPWATHFFDVVDGMWGRRSSESEQFVIRRLAPVTLADVDVVAAADRWLAVDHLEGLRRLVLKIHSDLLRVVTTRGIEAGRRVVRDVDHDVG